MFPIMPCGRRITMTATSAMTRDSGDYVRLRRFRRSPYLPFRAGARAAPASTLASKSFAIGW